MGRNCNRPKMRRTNAKSRPFYVRANSFEIYAGKYPRSKGPHKDSKRGKTR